MKPEGTSADSFRRAEAPREGSRAWLAAGLVAAACSCGPHEAHAPAIVAARPAPPAAPHEPGTRLFAPLATGSAEPPVDAAPAGRIFFGEPGDVPLPITLEPVAGGRSLFATAQAAGDGRGWMRRYDAARGAWGPPVALIGESFHSAYDLADGRYAVVTADAQGICIATYRVDASASETHGCAALSPAAIALVGDRLALIEASIETPPRAAARPAATKKKTPSKAPSKKSSKKKPPRKTKAGGAKADAAKADAKAGGAKADAKAGGAKADATKAGGKKTPAKPVTEAPRAPGPRSKVNVSLRWALPDGTFDDESRPIGLRFEAPQDGMGLLEAVGGPRGVELLWYESASLARASTAPAPAANSGAAAMRPAPPSRLGKAAIATGVIGADGRLDTATRRVLAVGGLGYGLIEGHREPHLWVGEAGPLFVDVTGPSGECGATLLAPLAELSADRVTCAVDPLGIGARTLSGGDAARMKALLDEDPRRAAGQRATSSALVTWAGDRGFYLAGGKLRSVSRAGEPPRHEPAPLVARRSRLAWSAIAKDGEGLAQDGGKLYRLTASGAVAPVEATIWNAETRRSLGARELPDADRRRAARIGDAWWIARGDVLRVVDGQRIEALAGRARPDTSALTGGASSGLFLELAGGSLRVTGIANDGSAAPLGAPASPVRAGFDACERAAGGALVTGVSAADPGKVVALSIDAGGRLSTPRATTLAVTPGELLVRLTALPAGGALLTDAARKRVVWLDDDANELGAAEWPLDESHAACEDGRPARRQVPSADPGRFVEVPGVAAEGACTSGETVWAEDGTLRWFGTAERGPGARAEAGVLLLGAPSPGRAAPVAPSSTSAGDRPAPSSTSASDRPSPGPACPSDMVLVAGKLCVDRFESMLIDSATGEPLSPDYPATPNLLEIALGEGFAFKTGSGDVRARALPLPFLPAFQRGSTPVPVAVSRFGARPSGYVTGLVAESACAASGKRLCTADEFVTACRGEDDTLFPYGDDYEDGVCNVFREGHPASILHGNPSIGHLDPRLDRVATSAGPLLRTTGGTPACRSRWGSDAVYDMVGNLDEWIDEPGGAFAGGFYSRSTRSGCEAMVTAHPKPYLDYSTGVRCCSDAHAAPSAR